MQQLLDMPSPPTTVICYNDLMAFGAESALGERGLFAGEDISLIGNDGVAACAYSNPPLTTIAVEPLALGKQAAQQIYGVLRNQTHRSAITSIARPCKFALPPESGGVKCCSEKLFLAILSCPPFNSR